MQVKVSEDSLFERTLEVVLDQAKVDTAYDRAFGRAAKRLALPGFRRGKVPMTMAKKYITDEGLGSDVVEDLIPSAYHEALTQHKLSPISEPKWELVQRKRGQDLVFKVKFEVKPTIAIKDYKGIAIKAHDRTVAQDKIDAALLELRTAHATLVTAEPRPVVAGDIGVVDYHATLNGEAFDGGHAENSLLELKPESFIPGFIDNIVGLEPGQEREFDITFPEGYGNKSLSGQLVHFTFKLRELKEKQLPEVDDEFAKKVSQAENVEGLMTMIRENLESQTERVAREDVSMRICRKLVAQVEEAHVPRSLLAWRTNQEIRRRLQELSRVGLTLEQYLANAGVTQDVWLQQMTQIGMAESRLQLLLESIGDAENLDVNNEELEQLFAIEAQQRGVSVDDLKGFVRKENSEEAIGYAILSAKVRDFLFDSANIEYVPVGTVLEEEEAPAADDASEKPAKGKAKSKAKTAEEPAAEAAPAEESKPKAKKAKAEEPAAETKEAAPAPKAKKAKAAEEPAAEAPAEEKPKAKKPAAKKKTDA